MKTVESKLKSEKMPEIHLQEHHDVAVKVANRKQHDELMQIYEAGNWTWVSGTLPTDYRNIVTFSETHIFANNNFTETGNPRYFPQIRVLTLKDFYKAQGIESSKVKEITDWFKKNKPYRESKKPLED